jgi:hypothetical protein
MFMPKSNDHCVHGAIRDKYSPDGGLVDSREQRTSAEFGGDGDILGGYCRREEDDCTGAAANAATLSMSLTKWNELLEV